MLGMEVEMSNVIMIVRNKLFGRSGWRWVYRATGPDGNHFASDRFDSLKARLTVKYGMTVKEAW